MPITTVDLGSTYAFEGGALAIPVREYTEADGTTWIEAEISWVDSDIIEYYPKVKFLEMVLQKMSIETYRDFD
jgi:hypothetical protein